MTACDNWVGKLVSAVENSPDWFTTAFFITFDDFGGFYDQVYPGTNNNPDLTQQGPRVPVIIASPWVKRGYTDTTHTTFAGILAFTEHNFGLAPLGANDAEAYDFSNAFEFAQRPLTPARMVHTPLPLYARHLRIPKAVENDPS